MQIMTADAGAPPPKSSSHVTITSCISHHEGRGCGVSRRIPDTRFAAPAFVHYMFGWVCAFDLLRLALNSEAGTCVVICSSAEGSALVSCDTFNVMAWSVTISEAWFSKEKEKNQQFEPQDWSWTTFRSGAASRPVRGSAAHVNWDSGDNTVKGPTLVCIYRRTIGRGALWSPDSFPIPDPSCPSSQQYCRDHLILGIIVWGPHGDQVMRLARSSVPWSSS